MKRLILFLLFITCFGFAESQNDTSSVSQNEKPPKYLHISTIPVGADIFVGSSAPDYSRKPSAVAPAFIPIKGNESHLLIALFKPEFVDTLIDVNLSKKDTSFLIISLKPSYDSETSLEQQKMVSKRTHRSIGKSLMISAIVPFVASVISAGITQYEINKANNAKKFLDNSVITSGEKYTQTRKEFFDRKSSAKSAKKVTIGTLVGSTALFTAGLILFF